MKYVALLRGINVGGKNMINMKLLKAMFESSGFANVSTYINSGNILFESGKARSEISDIIAKGLKREFGCDVPVLVKTGKEMKIIADAIPEEWSNDTGQKTDVAYLYEEIDSGETLDQLPVRKEFLNIRYVKGAIIWNVDRSNYNKSNLSKIAGHKLYKFMTVRNVNTARFLAGEEARR